MLRVGSGFIIFMSLVVLSPKKTAMFLLIIENKYAHLFLLGVLLRGYFGSRGSFSVLGNLNCTEDLNFLGRFPCAPRYTLFLA